MDKHWSGRFIKSTKEEVETFTASLFFDAILVEEDILGSCAHVQMLTHVGILNREEGKKIQEGLRAVLALFAQGKITLKGSDEDIHMKVERELTALIGPIAGKLHTARSRNDQVALDLHLYLRSSVVLIVEQLNELILALLSKAKENAEVIMPGYTHLQRAQPILFSHHLLSYVSMFQRDIKRLEGSLSRINQLPLGACALAGTGFPIDSQMVADLLKFDEVYENSMDAVSDRDFIVEFLATAALIMTHLSRLSEEIILWCTQEFAFIELDDAYCTGSSIMPQKKNPDIPELVRGKTGRVYGSLLSTLTMLKGLPLSYNKDMQEDKEALFDAVKTVMSSLSIYKGLIATMQILTENMLLATKKGLLNATELADYLAGKGIPFREAHAIVGKMVRYCLEGGCKLEDLHLDEFKVFSAAFSDDVFEILDLKKIVNSKNSMGGTSFLQVEKQHKNALKNFEKTKAWISEKQTLFREARESLLLQ